MLGLNSRRFWLYLFLGCLGVGLLPPALALGQVAPPAPEVAPPGAAPPEPKKEEPPTTCGPLISDTCLPIETNHLYVQLIGAYSLYATNFSSNWRRTALPGNFSTFYMPLKICYGPMKNLETYVVIPYVQNFVTNANSPLAGSASADYGGIGDISSFIKYQFLEETETRPAATAVFGTGFPSGHASRINPRFFGADAVGTGAFTFTTGVNFYKWLKPFLVYSNVWLSSPVNLYPDDASHDNVRSREYATFNLAVEYPFSKRWVGLAEYYSTWTWTNISTIQGYQSPYTKMGVLAGVEFLATEKWSVATGCAFDLYGKGGPAYITPMVSVIYNFF